MGTRILAGEKVNESGNGAVFYCGNSGRAFGPLFGDADEAEAFLQWLEADPRQVEHDAIVRRLSQFRVEREQQAIEEHEAAGGKFALKAPSSRADAYVKAIHADRPYECGWSNEAIQFDTFAAAYEMRKSRPTLSHLEVVRL